jgi:hypothetical protein
MQQAPPDPSRTARRSAETAPWLVALEGGSDPRSPRCCIQARIDFRTILGFRRTDDTSLRPAVTAKSSEADVEASRPWSASKTGAARRPPMSPLTDSCGSERQRQRASARPRTVVRRLSPRATPAHPRGPDGCSPRFVEYRPHAPPRAAFRCRMSPEALTLTGARVFGPPLEASRRRGPVPPDHARRRPVRGGSSDPPDSLRFDGAPRSKALEPDRRRPATARMTTVRGRPHARRRARMLRTRLRA